MMILIKLLVHNTGIDPVLVTKLRINRNYLQILHSTVYTTLNLII